jgi:hypothetical protein
MIRHDAVQFLRHAPVEAAQPGFDVGDRDAELGRGEGSGQGRVGVAKDDDSIRPGSLEQGLKRDEHPAGLVAVAAATDSEGVVRPRQAKLTEEVARHCVVVVLARVHKDLLVDTAERWLERGGLDELWPRTDDAG